MHVNGFIKLQNTHTHTANVKIIPLVLRLWVPLKQSFIVQSM